LSCTAPVCFAAMAALKIFDAYLFWLVMAFLFTVESRRLDLEKARKILHGKAEALVPPGPDEGKSQHIPAAQGEVPADAVAPPDAEGASESQGEGSPAPEADADGEGESSNDISDPSEPESEEANADVGGEGEDKNEGKGDDSPPPKAADANGKVESYVDVTSLVKDNAKVRCCCSKPVLKKSFVGNLQAGFETHDDSCKIYPQVETEKCGSHHYGMHEYQSTGKQCMILVPQAQQALKDLGLTDDQTSQFLKDVAGFSLSDTYCQAEFHNLSTGFLSQVTVKAAALGAEVAPAGCPHGAGTKPVKCLLHSLTKGKFEEPECVWCALFGSDAEACYKAGGAFVEATKAVAAEDTERFKTAPYIFPPAQAPAPAAPTESEAAPPADAAAGAPVAGEDSATTPGADAVSDQLGAPPAEAAPAAPETGAAATHQGKAPPIDKPAVPAAAAAAPPAEAPKSAAIRALPLLVLLATAAISL